MPQKKLLVLLGIFLILLVSCSRKEGGMEVFFCPREDCIGIFREFAIMEPICALYDIDDPELKLLFDPAYVLTEDSNYEGFGVPISSEGYMHHKFCVIGDYVLTGSFNPTKSELDNFNNVIFMQSSSLANAYRKEWKRLSANRWGTSGAAWKNQTHERKVVFCKKGKCADTLLEYIKNARFSIEFMLFSFTDQKIIDALLHKDIGIRGIMEPTGNKDAIRQLRNAGITIRLENTSAKLHHKVWIIDDVIITGSYNPTKNGNLRNDENMLIIKDAHIAEEFREEFDLLWN